MTPRKSRSFARLARLLLLAGAAALCPAPAHAQLLKTIRSRAEARVRQSKAHVDSTVLAKTGSVADSTLGKTDRAVAKTADAVGGVMDTAITRTSRGVRVAAGSVARKRAEDPLASGHLVLSELHFAAGSADLPADAATLLQPIARAMAQSSGAYLVEGHATDGADAAADQALSTQRAAAVKSALVAAGVPAARLFATGYGATRPAADGGSATRIELTRMQ